MVQPVQIHLQSLSWGEILHCAPGTPQPPFTVFFVVPRLNQHANDDQSKVSNYLVWGVLKISKLNSWIKRFEGTVRVL